jgi:hypothetical protein
VQAGAIERLFARFDAHLRAAGYLAMSGQIVDASIVAAPRQRMSDEERAIVKGGGIPEGWKEKAAKLAQKGEPMSAPRVRAPWANDARWTLKRGRRKRRPDGSLMAEIATPVFGYSERENAMVRVNPRTHINVDRRFGLIRKWSVTDAFGAVLEPVAADPSPHDGRELGRLLDRENIALGVWADTAYRSQKNEKRIKAAGLRSMIHFRKPPGKGLKPQHQRANAARSKVRAAVEHVFAEQKHRMALFVRTIGIARARAKIRFANLAYNMKRLVSLERREAEA